MVRAIAVKPPGLANTCISFVLDVISNPNNIRAEMSQSEDTVDNR